MKNYCMAFTRLETNSDASHREQYQESMNSHPFLKRILIVDDDPDITLAFKVGF
jgi:hypothetical protein